MKIAQVAPLFVSVPPPGYGGTERVVSYLTEELVRQGHDVTLYATGDSNTRAKLISVRDTTVWDKHSKPISDIDPLLWHTLHLDRVVQDSAQYDVIHFHMDVHHLPFTKMIETPTLTTFHNNLTKPDYNQLFTHFNKHNVVSISNNHQQSLPMANWAATVYHGIDRNLYSFHEKHEDYFVFVGRVNRDKRPDWAIEIAQGAGVKLKIAARIEDKQMWEQMQPLPEGVEYVGEISDAQKNDFIGNAKAMLFPIDWAEPFGMVMIEAMACGVPVIAFNRGSVPEILEDGLTAFIVDNVQEAIVAAGKLDTLDRHKVRAEFERRFTVETMANQYVRLYEDLINHKL